MLKLLITLCCSLVLAILLLHLRHQRLELNYQMNHLHNQIRDSQARLWSQQLQIAVFTAPNAISKTVGDQKLDMVPESPLPAKQGRWIDPQDNPDAE
jgi:cell division protein FtsL